mgnify:CR=1 FL=1
MDEQKITRIKDTIDVYLEGSKDISDTLIELNAYVSDCNMTLSDLDHFLELEDLTNPQVANLTLRRRKALRDRRRAKDFMSVIDHILPKQTEGRTTQDRYEFAVRGLGERVYTPRKINVEEATRSLSS